MAQVVKGGYAISKVADRVGIVRMFPGPMIVAVCYQISLTWQRKDLDAAKASGATPEGVNLAGPFLISILLTNLCSREDHAPYGSDCR